MDFNSKNTQIAETVLKGDWKFYQENFIYQELFRAIKIISKKKEETGDINKIITIDIRDSSIYFR